MFRSATSKLTNQIISEKKPAGFKLKTESRSRSDGFGKVKMLDF